MVSARAVGLRWEWWWWTPAGVGPVIWAELLMMPVGVGGEVEEAGNVDMELQSEGVSGVAGDVL